MHIYGAMAPARGPHLYRISCRSRGSLQACGPARLGLHGRSGSQLDLGLDLGSGERVVERVGDARQDVLGKLGLGLGLGLGVGIGGELGLGGGTNCVRHLASMLGRRAIPYH